MITPFEFERSCQGIERTTVSKAKITVTSKQIHFGGELARTVKQGLLWLLYSVNCISQEIPSYQ